LEGYGMMKKIQLRILPLCIFLVFSWNCGVPTLDRSLLDALNLRLLESLLKNKEPSTPTPTPILEDVAMPIFSPPPGNFSAAVSLAISSTTSGSAVYYTNDGSTPNCSATGSTLLYTAPINIPLPTANMTIKSIACMDGRFSTVQSGMYNVALPRLRIFLTSNQYNGDLGGKAGADAKCNDPADTNKPTTGTYKAMLRFSDRIPAGADWVFLPATTYYRPDQTTVIATTDAGKKFPASLTSTITTTNIIARTGFANGFGISINNCTEFTDGVDNSNNVSSGWANSLTTDTMLASSGMPCTSTSPIICVEQ
jgi:hypothetical protein